MAFFEVDEQDRPLIQDSFPAARCFGGPLLPGSIPPEALNSEVLGVFVYSQITEEVLAAFPRLRMLITRSAGTDHINLEAAQRRGVAVNNIPGYAPHAIAEHTMALLLAAARHLPEAEARTQRLVFDFHGLRGKTLRGKTLGIIGTGSIGKLVAQIASAGFGMRVVAHDPSPNEAWAAEHGVRYATLEQTLQSAQFLSLHAPGTPNNRHLLSAPTLDLLPRGAIVINTSRGSLINTPDLVAALRSGRVSRAGLDVLEHEKNIAENREILQMPNVIITPHIAFFAQEAVEAMYRAVVQTVQDFCKGR